MPRLRGVSIAFEQRENQRENQENLDATGGNSPSLGCRSAGTCVARDFGQLEFRQQVGAHVSEVGDDLDSAALAAAPAIVLGRWCGCC